jgi:hypothetical protein
MVCVYIAYAQCRVAYRQCTVYPQRLETPKVMPKRKPKKIAKKAVKKPKKKNAGFKVSIHLHVKPGTPGKRAQFKVENLEILRDAGPDPGQH